MPFENVVFGGHQIQCGGDNLNSVPRNFNLDAFWNDRASSAQTVGQIIRP
jgi:hypothetical protein